VSPLSEDELKAAMNQEDLVTSFLKRLGEADPELAFLKTAEGREALLASSEGPTFRQFARDPQSRQDLGLNSEGSTADCFRQCLEARFPNHEEISDLFEIPIVLWLIRRMCEADQRDMVFHSRGDLYEKVSVQLISEAMKDPSLSATVQVDRLHDLLGVFAFEMTLFPEKYMEESKAYAVSQPRRVTQIRTAVGDRLGAPMTDGDWRLLVRMTTLTQRSLLETCSDSMLGFRHRSLREFYCGRYLARNFEQNWRKTVEEYVAPVAASSHWRWCWRFAMEIQGADPEVRATSLSALYHRPSGSGPLRRPTEMMFRAFDLMQTTPEGRAAIERFQSEFRERVTARKSVALQLVTDFDRLDIPRAERNFTRCPLNPEDDDREFWMGSDGVSDESRHRTAVAPFALQTTTVTREQFGLFDISYEEVEAGILQQYAPKPECPAVEISWYDAWCFCKWVGGRLPTEREWEYACRAGRDGEEFTFHFGATLSTDQANFRPRKNDRFQSDGSTEYRKQTEPVRSFKANAWGLWQMHGNVLEWCEDRYRATAYQNQSATQDASRENIAQDQSVPSDNKPNECLYRVLRGGSWNYSATNCRSAFRYLYSPSFRHKFTGIRVCIDM